MLNPSVREAMYHLPHVFSYTNLANVNFICLSISRNIVILVYIMQSISLHYLVLHTLICEILNDEVLLTVSCPIFPSILIAKNLLTGSLKNRSVDNLETQKKSISMNNSQFFDYLLYAKST